jgi:hypothetical protein
MRYCMDCDHYIAGGQESNCRASSKTHHVCALKEACSLYEDRREREKIVFAPIRMRKPPQRRRRC